MLKYAFVALTSLFALQMINADGVIIEDNTPTTLPAGGSTDVTVSINKGNVEGFAKLELELPAGLSAEAVSTSGASFTFSAQKAKFIWMAVPEQEEFSVTYTLRATENATGNLMVKGVFAYIKDQQRVDYELKNKMVSIGSAGDDMAEESPEDPDPAPGAEPEVLDQSMDLDGDMAEETTSDPEAMEVGAGDRITATVAYDGDDMQCLRFVEELSATEYNVRLEVVNNTLDGFCKISETMPSGCTAEELDSDGAVVTLEPNGIKFVWFDSPQSDSFEVTYRVRRFAGGNAPAITGSFSYVKDNAPYDQPVLNMGLTTSDPSLADTPDTTPVDPKIIATDPVPETGTDEPQDTGFADTADADQGNGGGEDTGSIATTEVEPELPDTPATTFPAPEVGITYKVQIAAAHRTVGKSYFISRHGFKEQFNIENHEGWVKYTTGQHEEYKDARDDRNRIRSQYATFNGPFVTAYSDGMRITVQEALMISNQQWYK